MLFKKSLKVIGTLDNMKAKWKSIFTNRSQEIFDNMSQDLKDQLRIDDLSDLTSSKIDVILNIIVKVE